MVKHPQMLAVLFRQLAAAQRRGLPAHEVAGVLAQDPEWTRAQRDVLARLADAMRGQATLSSAFGQVPMLVGTETVDLLRAAEAAGRLADTLDVLADDYAHLAEGTRGLQLALAWPLLVAGVIAVVIGVLAVYVVPAFEEAYTSFNADLPVQTQVFFAVTGVIGRTVWVWAPLLVLLLVAWRLGWRPPGVGGAFVRAWHGIAFVHRHALSRFIVRLLRWLQASAADSALGVAALAHLRGTEVGPALVRAAATLEASWRRQARPSEALAEAAVLPRRLALMAQLGERLDDLPAAYAQLTELAEAQEQLEFHRFERSCLLLVYGVLGLVVIYTLVSIYLPVFKLGAVI